MATHSSVAKRLPLCAIGLFAWILLSGACAEDAGEPERAPPSEDEVVAACEKAKAEAYAAVTGLDKSCTRADECDFIDKSNSCNSSATLFGGCWMPVRRAAYEGSAAKRLVEAYSKMEGCHFRKIADCAPSVAARCFKGECSKGPDSCLVDPAGKCCGEECVDCISIAHAVGPYCGEEECHFACEDGWRKEGNRCVPDKS